MSGGFEAPFYLVRRRRMIYHAMKMTELSRNGAALAKDRFVELLFPMMVCRFSATCTAKSVKEKPLLEDMQPGLLMIQVAWEHDHDAGCSH
jgi:hypothetical protein